MENDPHESILLHAHHSRFGLSDDRGAAWRVLDQGHLSNNVSIPDLANFFWLGIILHRDVNSETSLIDQIHRIALIALLEKGGPFVNFVIPQVGNNRMHLVRRQ